MTTSVTITAKSSETTAEWTAGPQAARLIEDRKAGEDIGTYCDRIRAELSMLVLEFSQREDFCTPHRTVIQHMLLLYTPELADKRQEMVTVRTLTSPSLINTRTLKRTAMHELEAGTDWLLKQFEMWLRWEEREVLLHL